MGHAPERSDARANRQRILDAAVEVIAERGGSAEVIKAYTKLGYTFFAAAVDVDLLHTGAAVLLKAVNES